MKSPRFLRLFVCVLTLTIAACGSDSDSDASVGETNTTTAAPTTSTSTTTAAPTTTVAPTTTAAPTTVADDATGSESELPEVDPAAEVVEAFSVFGVQFNEDEVACVIESDINLAEPDDLLYGLFLCAPEILAVESTEGLVVPGVKGEDLICATTEAIRAIGLMSRADVLAALESSDFPAFARDDAIARGQDICGLTEDQMVEVLDNQ